jgi:nicotinamidase-related amidase
MISLPSVKQIALIVHDMCNDSLKPGGHYPRAGEAPGTATLIANNVRLLDSARARGIAVFHTGHYLRPDAMDAPLGGRSSTLDVLKDGSWGAEPIDELRPAAGEWRIRKGGGFSAFTGTPLEKWLHRLGITTIVIGGSGTHAGIEATVRDMRELDFDAVIVSDACSGAGTDHHTASMLTLNFAQRGTTDEVVAALQAAAE